MPLHRVVVVGAGFAGLQLVKDLKRVPVSITLIDRRNHHLFQPLLYQVATSVLAPSEIAWPIRQIMRGRREVDVVLGEAADIQLDEQAVRLSDGTLYGYDTLVIASGVTHAYFGHDEWRQFAPGLKTGWDAAAIRNRLLRAFELADRSPKGPGRSALLTFVVVGGGPTGVELAGMVADLARGVFSKDFARLGREEARVILVEAGPRLLAAFHPSLSSAALEALTHKGVEVRLAQSVTACDEHGVSIGDTDVASRTVIWAAGVAASALARRVGGPVDKAGRVQVKEDLTVPEDSSIFVIGDAAAIRQADGTFVPGLAPAAKQQGHYVAQVIRARLRGQPQPPAFRYRHQGSLATIGHHAAVADFGQLRFTGFVAWWIWGTVHIFFLIGARSRLAVAISWLWAYLRRQPSARLIDEVPSDPSSLT